MTTEQSFAHGWYRARSLGNDVTLIWEAHIKPFYRCNIWHLRGRDRDLLIDSGFGMVPLRQHIPLLTGRPLIAVASHTHCDHIGGHYEFEERGVHDAERDIIAHPTRENTAILDWYVNLDMFCATPPADFEPSTFAIRPAPATAVLAAGDVVDLGDRAFEVVHIPGHSPGSIALWEAKTGILFTGDMVHNGPNGIGRLILYHSNENDYLASVERIRNMPVEVVHVGHFDSFGRARYVEVVDEYIAWKRQPGCPVEQRMANAATQP